MDTILPKTLLQETLDYYEVKKNYENVVSKSLPILFFGDLNQYFDSNLKIVTVGKNPSGWEFENKLGEKFNRFPKYRKTPYSLELSLCEYFKTDPYRNWFNHYDKYLNHFGYSFYDKSNFKRVIHTDICSPLSTNPVWSKLDKKITDELFKDGFEIWKNLVLELKPDIIIMCCPLTSSLKNLIFKGLHLEEISSIKTITEKEDKTLRLFPFILAFNSVSVKGFKTKLIFGGGSRQTPFGTVLNNDVKVLGEKTNSLIKRFF